MSFEALQQIAHPEKAHVLVHLADHEGDAPGQLSDHLERPLSTIYRYLAGLESAGLVYAKEDGGIKHYHLVPFRFLIEPEGLREMIQSPLDLATAYRKLLGKRQWGRVTEAAEFARKGEITLRQAANRSGLPYRGFMSVYSSLWLPSAKKTAPSGR